MYNNKKLSTNDEILLEIMQEQKYNLTKDGLYATLIYGERKKNVSVRSSTYKDYIIKLYHDRTGQYISEKAITQRLSIISAEMEFENDSNKLYAERYIKEDDTIFIDMSNSDLEYVEICGGEYHIYSCEDEPLFCGESIRKPMEVLSMEEAIENITEAPLDILDRYFNLEEDDMFLVKVWLVTSMNPKINMPLLYLLGGAGTGKSSMQRIIGKLLDPSSRGLINWDDTNLRDLSIMLDRSYLVNFDNVSRIHQKKSDLLCQCVTGGEKSYRRNYTDNEEIQFNVSARLTLSSVINCINREDLQSRTLTVNVPKIRDRVRIREEKFLEQFDKEKFQIMGELFLVLSMAMEKFPKWEQQHIAYHRMAGFEIFGSLVAHILDEEDGYERFMKIMHEKYIFQAIREDDSRIFIAGMMEMLEDEYDGYYKGSLKGLHSRICSWVTDSLESSYVVETCMNYDPFTKLIHNKEELFYNLGYDICFGRMKKDNTASVTIRKRNVDCEKTV